MAAHSLYLVLDMENDLVHEDGPNGKQGFGPQVQAREIIAKTAATIAKARAAGVRVGYVRVGFSPDYREAPPNSSIFSAAKKAGLFKLGTWGTEIHPDIAPEEGDFQIVKHRVSPFYGTNLGPILRANDIRKLHVSGVSTNAVVQAAVREGHDRDSEMTIIEDCCAATSAEEHANAIEGLRRFAAVTTANRVRFG